MKYTGEYTREISFPIGGIGTGSIGLGGNGRLLDWEIFNRPAKGSINGFSHFAIKTVRDNKPITYIINGDLEKDIMGQYRKQTFVGFGYGPETEKMAGFPHFRNVEFDGEFPIANLTFKDKDFPADVKMTAFNPFIPSDSKNSSIPAAFFEIEVNNTTDETLKYQIALSISNPFAPSLNKAEVKDGYRMLKLINSGADKGSTSYGDLTVATDCEKTYTQTYWYRGGWKDSIVSFWNDFNNVENIKERIYDEAGTRDGSTLVAEIEVSPRTSKKVRFILSWNVPNCYNYWKKAEEGTPLKTWKNYYATVFEDSTQSAIYSLKNWEDLYSRTLLFKNALFSTTLPEKVIDAASANLSVLKSPTVLRLEDGSFYGWEGVHELMGSCEGTCQHVWNYAYAMCFLFPDLERSIRDLEFKYSTGEDGRMRFRMMLPLGSEMDTFRPCVDGQMGAVIKCYREWKISGDNEWLKSHWEDIKKVLEYAWNPENFDAWDLDKDGILEGRQHHTLDMEMFAPSSWLEGMYMAALKAAAEMGEFLGDTQKAKEYRDMFDYAYNWTKENLFNGKYFIQKIDITDKSLIDRFSAEDKYWNEETGEIKYQIGEGSSIDQLLAQWHADLIGLGDIFDREQVSVAVKEMFKNNFKPSMRDFANPWRVFSLNDESGSVICVYPDGANKPKIPIPYCEETMTGFEYSFAGLLCSRNMIDEGFRVATAVRDRFDGKKRNPWNEFECGSNYARSMASFAIIPIVSGFKFDMTKNQIGFKPLRYGTYFWAIDGAWGTAQLNEDSYKFTVLGGEIQIKNFVTGMNSVSKVAVNGVEVPFSCNGDIISFDCSLQEKGEIYIYA